MFGNQYNQIEKETKGIVLNIEHFHVHDGEGIRTNIFLKGCTLHCAWCCNPESISPKPQIAHYKKLCVNCGNCMSVCPADCCSMDSDNHIQIEFDKCIACGKCVEKCLAGARELFGKEMSVAEVMDEIEKDSVYFLNSDGGITLSGGEACYQTEFAKEIAKAAHRRYIPVALETAAGVSWDKIWSVASEVDEVLFDIKTLSLDDFNKKVAKISLGIVLNNLNELKKRGKIITLRCPIVPRFNNTMDHIFAVEELASKVGISKIDLLPFHQLGKHKYASIGMRYELDALPEMDRAEVERMAEYLRSKGYKVSVGG